MVLVINEQNFAPIDRLWVEEKAVGFLQKLKLDKWELAVVFVDLEAMGQYNESYRGKNGATDVLSFPFYCDLKYPEITEKWPAKEAKDLGDIIFCPERIIADCNEFGLEFSVRLERLLAHSIVHLLGHDHKTPEQIEAMKPLEQLLLGREVDEYREDD